MKRKLIILISGLLFITCCDDNNEGKKKFRLKESYSTCNYYAGDIQCLYHDNIRQEYSYDDRNRIVLITYYKGYGDVKAREDKFFYHNSKLDSIFSDRDSLFYSEKILYNSDTINLNSTYTTDPNDIIRRGRIQYIMNQGQIKEIIQFSYNESYIDSLFPARLYVLKWRNNNVIQSDLYYTITVSPKHIKTEYYEYDDKINPNLIPDIYQYFNSYRSSQNNIKEIRCIMYNDTSVTKFDYKYDEHGLPIERIDSFLYYDPILVIKKSYIFEEYF